MSRRSAKYGATMRLDGRNPFWRSTGQVNPYAAFAPDQVTLDQWAAQHRKEEPAAPERALCLALLEDAIKNFQKYHGDRSARGRALFDYERRWIEDEREHWGTFIFCCRVAHIEPSWLRRKLLAALPTWGDKLNGHRVESAPKLLTRHAVGVSA